MTRVTTGHKPSESLHKHGHNGSQWVTDLTKTYINMVSPGHTAGYKSQILMAGVAQEPCDLGHKRRNGSERVTNLAKTYINTVSQGHKAHHKSKILTAGMAQEPYDPSHNGSHPLLLHMVLASQKMSGTQNSMH